MNLKCPRGDAGPDFPDSQVPPAPASLRLCSVTHTNSPLSPRVIPGAPSSVTCPQPGFWWGWPAGAWTVGTPSTPASSPGSTTLPTGSTRSGGSPLPPIPHLLLRSRFHISLCRPPAHPAAAQPAYVPRLGSCCCLPSGTHGRPCGDPPSPSVQLSASSSSLLAGTFHASPPPTPLALRGPSRTFLSISCHPQAKPEKPKQKQ